LRQVARSEALRTASTYRLGDGFAPSALPREAQKTVAERQALIQLCARAEKAVPIRDTLPAFAPAVAAA
jgi:hypothetical protein